MTDPEKPTTGSLLRLLSGVPEPAAPEPATDAKPSSNDLLRRLAGHDLPEGA